MLPREFVLNFVNQLPQKVYLHVPSGTLWPGFFDRSNGTVGGLQYMVSFYGLTKHNIFLLEYCGGTKFNLRILNCYAVEIEYATSSIPTKLCALQIDKRNCNQHMKEFKFQELQDDMLEFAFKFNAYNQNEVLFDLKLKAKHLLEGGFAKVSVI